MQDASSLEVTCLSFYTYSSENCNEDGKVGKIRLNQDFLVDPGILIS